MPKSKSKPKTKPKVSIGELITEWRALVVAYNKEQAAEKAKLQSIPHGVWFRYGSHHLHPDAAVKAEAHAEMERWRKKMGVLDDKEEERRAAIFRRQGGEASATHHGDAGHHH